MRIRLAACTALLAALGPAAVRAHAQAPVAVETRGPLSAGQVRQALARDEAPLAACVAPLADAARWPIEIHLHAGPDGRIGHASAFLRPAPSVRPAAVDRALVCLASALRALPLPAGGADTQIEVKTVLSLPFTSDRPPATPPSAPPVEVSDVVLTGVAVDTDVPGPALVAWTQRLAPLFGRCTHPAGATAWTQIVLAVDVSRDGTVQRLGAQADAVAAADPFVVCLERAHATVAAPGAHRGYRAVLQYRVRVSEPAHAPVAIAQGEADHRTPSARR